MGGDSESVFASVLVVTVMGSTDGAPTEAYKDLLKVSLDGFN